MKKQNNGLVRNPFLYLLIIFFLVTGFQYFYSGNTAGRSEKINYTELVKEITADNASPLVLKVKAELRGIPELELTSYINWKVK